MVDRGAQCFVRKSLGLGELSAREDYTGEHEAGGGPERGVIQGAVCDLGDYLCVLRGAIEQPERELGAGQQ